MHDRSLFDLGLVMVPVQGLGSGVLDAGGSLAINPPDVGESLLMDRFDLLASLLDNRLDLRFEEGKGACNVGDVELANARLAVSGSLGCCALRSGRAKDLENFEDLA